MGQNQSTPFELEVGSRQGGPRTPSGWNQLEATLVDELVGLWAGRDPAVVWAPEWKEFEILTWADSIFLVTGSVALAARRTREEAEENRKRRSCTSIRAAWKSCRVVLQNVTGPCWVEWSEGVQLGYHFTGAWLFSGWHGTHRGPSQTTSAAGAKDVYPLLCFPQIPQEEHLGAFYTTVERVNCGAPAVGLRQCGICNWSLFRRTDGSAALWVGGRVTMSSGWKGFVRLNVLLWGADWVWHRALAAMYGWAGHLPRKEGPQSGAAGTVAWRGMVGDYEGYRGWQSRPLLETSEEKLVPWVRARLDQDLRLGLVGTCVGFGRAKDWSSSAKQYAAGLGKLKTSFTLPIPFENVDLVQYDCWYRQVRAVSGLDRSPFGDFKGLKFNGLFSAWPWPGWATFSLPLHSSWLVVRLQGISPGCPCVVALFLYFSVVFELSFVLLFFVCSFFLKI